MEPLRTPCSVGIRENDGRARARRRSAHNGRPGDPWGESDSLRRALHHRLHHDGRRGELGLQDEPSLDGAGTGDGARPLPENDAQSGNRGSGSVCEPSRGRRRGADWNGELRYFPAGRVPAFRRWTGECLLIRRNGVSATATSARKSRRSGFLMRVGEECASSQRWR